MLLQELFESQIIQHAGWFNPGTNTFHDVGMDEHMDFAAEHPELFGLTDEDVFSDFKQYKVRSIQDRKKLYVEWIRVTYDPGEIGIEGLVHTLKHPNTIRFTLEQVRAKRTGQDSVWVFVDVLEPNAQGRLATIQQPEFELPTRQGEMIRWFKEL